MGEWCICRLEYRLRDAVGGRLRRDWLELPPAPPPRAARPAAPPAPALPCAFLSTAAAATLCSGATVYYRVTLQERFTGTSLDLAFSSLNRLLESSANLDPGAN
ncbi:hypothetical protein JYU34_021040 [Plutella xylostella]|uniref:Uncharacterized protein n=1 Tax=Plutella xylostella TaxID=51655 RepID=A0ABQ7PU27_PLUXY|nr:hypothetical protein JYU34_021040 [Plutella xylostella]